jgi:plastocyanin
LINTNGTFSFTFSTVGSFPYHCTVHTNMTATVIVH